MDKKYCLIEFFAEGEGTTKPAEVVPVIWVDKNQKFVYWPRKTGAAFKALVKKAEKEPTETWTIQRYNRIFGEYSLYAEALAKLRKSEDTSNLESELYTPDFPQGYQRRRRDSKRKNSTSEEDSDSSVSTSQDAASAPKYPSFCLGLNSANRSKGSSPDDVPAGIKNISHPLPQGSSNRNIVDSVRPGPHPSAEEAEADNILRPTGAQCFQSSVSAVPDINSGVSVEDPAKNALVFEASLNEQVTDVSLIGISLATSDDVASIQEIKAHIETTRPEGGKTRLDFSKLPPLPVADRNCLIDFEEWISLEANFCLLRSYLGLTGGSSTEKITRNILKKLISTVLRKDSNFTGKGGKVEFQKLKLFQCIKDAVRVTKDDSKDEDIQKATIEWLRNTKKNG